MKVPWSDEEWRSVLVYGMARSGIAATRFLRRRGVGVVAVDRRGDSAVAELEADEAIVVRAEDPAALEGVDGVVLSPGVPRSQPLVRAALAAGLPVIAEVELAFPFLRGRVIAITGSNGKSTTAALTFEMLRATGVEAVLCGNIGEPLTSKLDGPEGRVFVVELSSFQLESVQLFRADAAALLNLSPDHLDRYADFDAYAAAKARIFERQSERDTAVLNADDPEVRRAVRIERARRRLFSRRVEVEDGCWTDGSWVLESGPDGAVRELFSLDELRLRGTHNLENAMAAALLALAGGADREGVRRAVGGFAGLPHRMQLVAQLAGVDWFDDSKGTNVGATRQSLEGFPDGSVHLILGGRSKGADFGSLRDAVARKAAFVYLVGEAADEIAEEIGNEVPYARVGDLETAVRRAADRAVEGQVVLLSPACASFDQFESFEHRGRRFRELVEGLRGAGDG